MQERLQKLPRSIMAALHRGYILTYAKHSIDYRFPGRFARTLDQAAPCTEIFKVATQCICEILLLMHELVVAHSHRLKLDVHCVRISLFIWWRDLGVNVARQDGQLSLLLGQDCKYTSMGIPWGITAYKIRTDDEVTFKTSIFRNRFIMNFQFQIRSQYNTLFAPWCIVWMVGIS